MIDVLDIVDFKVKKLDSFLKISGGHSSGEIPVPIPNTEVKSTTPKILGW